MSDIVERLRDSSCDPSDVCCGLDGCGLFREAAYALEAKDAEIARLREALREIAKQVSDDWDDHCGWMRDQSGRPDAPHEPTCPYDIARRALGEASDE